jgi:hypothetical protein
MKQLSLFDSEQTVESEKIALYALGDFQARGLKLAERELPLDRLLGAFRRASERFNCRELSDQEIVEALKKLGANVKQVPSFFAKHPFRIVIPIGLAEHAIEFFKSQQRIEDDKST